MGLAFGFPGEAVEDGDGFVEAAVLEVEAAAVVHHAADRGEAMAAEDVVVHGVVGDLQEGGTAAHGFEAGVDAGR
jgi:hypothetical protein